MGNNCCCTLKDYHGLPRLRGVELRNLIKIQSKCRQYLAKKKLKETRERKLRGLFGKLSLL